MGRKLNWKVFHSLLGCASLLLSGCLGSAVLMNDITEGRYESLHHVPDGQAPSSSTKGLASEEERRALEKNYEAGKILRDQTYSPSKELPKKIS